MSKRNIFFLIGAFITLAGYILGYYQKPKTVLPASTSTPVPVIEQYTLAKVTKVYDGDTIQIEGGVKVRYIGIDTAEVYPTQGCYAFEAKKENENLVLGKEVKLVKDVSETDKYGRLLSYVYVGDVFINEELVRSGFAKIMTVPPDVKYKDLFLDAQAYARENKLGLWGKCF